MIELLKGVAMQQNGEATAGSLAGLRVRMLDDAEFERLVAKGAVAQAAG